MSFAATVTWNPNTEPDLAGYKVYAGTQSRVYTQTYDVPIARNTTLQVIGGLDSALIWYFAVTAYDTSSNESVFSAEVSKADLTAQTTIAFGRCSSYVFGSA